VKAKSGKAQSTEQNSERDFASVIRSWGEKKMKKRHTEFEVTLFRIAEC